MKIFTLFQLLILAGALLFAGVFNVTGQESSCNSRLTDDDSGSEICLRKGEKLCVRLKSRLATGFGWKISKTDYEKLRLVSETVEKDDEDEGTIEFQIFTFEALAKGSFSLELSYARPWEKDKPPAKKFDLNIRIK